MVEVVVCQCGLMVAREAPEEGEHSHGHMSPNRGGESFY